MSTTSSKSDKQEQLQKLAKALEKATSKSEIKRLNTLLDGILEMEESPPPEDPELMEAWEKSRK